MSSLGCVVSTLSSDFAVNAVVAVTAFFFFVVVVVVCVFVVVAIAVAVAVTVAVVVVVVVVFAMLANMMIRKSYLPRSCDCWWS